MSQSETTEQKLDNAARAAGTVCGICGNNLRDNGSKPIEKAEGAFNGKEVYLLQCSKDHGDNATVMQVVQATDNAPGFMEIRTRFLDGAEGKTPAAKKSTNKDAAKAKEDAETIAKLAPDAQTKRDAGQFARSIK